jgi:beta-galactosidase
MKKQSLLLALILFISGVFSNPVSAQLPLAASRRHTFEIGSDAFLLDGKPIVLRVGEMHFARVPREYWRQRLQLLKSMGMNAVCVYLFWNYHEFEQGKFDCGRGRPMPRSFAAPRSGRGCGLCCAPARTHAPSGTAADCRGGF